MLDIVSLNEQQLSRAIGPALARFIGTMPHETLNAESAEQALKDSGAYIARIGKSSSGRSIDAVVVGRGVRHALVYAYPHPEEPIGAASVVWLAEQAVKKNEDLVELLDEWKLVLIACADPDGAYINKEWVDRGDLDSLVRSGFRPHYTHPGIDYGFPIDWGPFLQKPGYGDDHCWREAQCVNPSCGEMCDRFMYPKAPFPESFALAETIARFEPEVVIALHNSPMGGLYDFTSWKPSKDVVEKFDLISQATGVPRHLGEPIDRHPSWTKERRDFLVEPSLGERVTRFRQADLDVVNRRWAGNVSLAQYVESILPGSRVFMPEAVHFSNPVFADMSPSDERREIEVAYETGVLKAWGSITLPNGDSQKVHYGSELAGKLGPGKHTIDATVGVLGVEAVALKRWVDGKVMEVWKSLPEVDKEADGLVAAELRSMAHKHSPFSNNDDEYKVADLPRATKADAANFKWRMTLTAAQQAGLLLRYLNEQGISNSHTEEIETIVSSMIESIPTDLMKNVRYASEQSQLARILCIINSL